MKREQIRIRASMAEGGMVTVVHITAVHYCRPRETRELFRESESPPDTPSPEPVGSEPPEGICRAHVLQQCRVLSLNSILCIYFKLLSFF